MFPPKASPAQWNREKTCTLIDLLKQRSVLWNSKDKNYKCKLNRERAVKEIQHELEEFSLEEIKTKIHTLRSQFRREHRNIAASSKSGSGTDDIHQPKLWCYDLLAFMVESDVPRTSESNLEINSELDEYANAPITAVRTRVPRHQGLAM